MIPFEERTTENTCTEALNDYPPPDERPALAEVPFELRLEVDLQIETISAKPPFVVLVSTVAFDKTTHKYRRARIEIPLGSVEEAQAIGRRFGSTCRLSLHFGPLGEQLALGETCEPSASVVEDPHDG